MLPAPSKDGLAIRAWYASWNHTVSKLELHGSISNNDTLLLFLQIIEKLKEKVLGIVGDCKA